MGEISAYLKENNIKNAFSLTAPKEASAIQEIITGKLRWTKADYDYIGVNLYPDDNTNTYVENLKKAVESCSDKQLIISNIKYAHTNEADTANVYTQADNIIIYYQQRLMSRMPVEQFMMKQYMLEVGILYLLRMEMHRFHLPFLLMRRDIRQIPAVILINMGTTLD